MSRKLTHYISALSFALLLLSGGHNLHAQYYLNGTDPGSTRWNSVKTQSFKILYPKGLDSLARVYGTELEKYKIPVGGSIGYVPNQQYRRQMPVILHAYNGVANGMVTWAPRRMELYTIMDPYEPDIMPWTTNLAIHESRHVSQMQFGKDGLFKIGHYLIGESFTGFLSGAYPNVALLEGDAVVAETALTNSGRGREADFLQWYRVAFDNGDMRSWYKWRYGSQKYYAPNYYTIGYMTISGIRYLYDDPSFTQRYFSRLAHGNPIRFLNFQKTIKTYSGKSLEKTFKDIAQTYKEIWQMEDQNRLSPIPFTRITATPKKYTVYLKNVLTDEGIISVKSGLNMSPTLVRIDMNGEESVIRPFAGNISKLEYDANLGRIYWSETIPDKRWELAGTGEIQYMNKGDKKIYSLTKGGRFFNPSVSPDGTKVAATEYPIEGGSAICIIDANSGKVLSRTFSPSGMQIVESAWTSTGIIISAITDNGFGLFKVNGSSFDSVLPEAIVKIKNLHSYGTGVAFTCDMTGVNEVYTLLDGNLSQITSTKYGASDFVISGDEIIFANLCTDGEALVRAPLKDVAQNLNFKAHLYPIAEKLSEQEKTLNYSKYTSAQFSQARNYKKVPHLLNLHSWAPMFYSVNQIESQSFDSIDDIAGLGMLLAFQNNLGSFYGTAGFQRAYTDKQWTNSLHLDFTYTGLYPVFEFKFDLGGRNALQYGLKETEYGNNNTQTLVGHHLDTPYMAGEILAYVPLKFDRGGWHRGLIPQLKYDIANDFMNTSMVLMDATGALDVGAPSRFEGSIDGINTMMQRLTSSVRGYIIRPTASSQIYPRLGIGAEVGFRTRINLGPAFNSSMYAYTYGYLPGIIPEHGIRLTATYQHMLNFDAVYHENAVITAPRGFASSRLSQYLSSFEKDQLRLTFEYAMPVLPVDWSFLSPVCYIRNFELRPHFDFSPVSKGSLYSVGSAFNAHLGNVLFLPAEATYGIVFSYNGGSAFNAINDEIGNTLTRTYIGFSFNIDL